MNDNYFGEFGVVLLFLIGGAMLITFILIVASLIRPKRPNEEKSATYECGEEPTGTAWGHFNIRFYVVALIFILFDVEIIFLFPWATVFGQRKLIAISSGLWGWYTFTEMFIFITILAFGLAYAWRKGLLEWDKPHVRISDKKVKNLLEKYQTFNEKYRNHSVREVTRN